MVFDLLRRKQQPVETKTSAAARVVAWHGSTGGAGWSPRDSSSLTRSGFAGNPVGYRAVKMIIEAAAALPLVLQDGTQRYDSHPLLALLARPNAAQGRAELLEALFGHLLLSGNAYIEAVSDPDGRDVLPVELHVLRPDRMSVVPGSDGWPVAYDYSVSGRKHRFDVTMPCAPICHLRSFHPQDDHYGLSPMQAAAMAVDVHTSASRWSKALLDNAARPSGALVWSGSDGQGLMAEDQFRRLSDEIEMNFQGARNAGRPMVLEGGLDWKPMGFSPSDMEFHQTKDAAAREIALAFGVPPMLLGLPGDATYANYQEANRAFYRLTVLPLVTRVTATLSDWLSRYQGSAVTLKPDLDQVSALASEREAQWRRVASADFLSVAEKRRLLGLPPQEEAERDD
ncbi:phage portal protein [Phaeobacter porticola]|uniref:Putative gene transfer agent portal protein n=1 Tax=Phaeobacter porticola TaxID=1844006 RepID=A0A1L3I4Z6_9RHOB|nr:phage portal protein [Phaeobacter porticola]APG47210.1 putative gene transfer agent portal protein [Phaeobacter porticola]